MNCLMSDFCCNQMQARIKGLVGPRHCKKIKAQLTSFWFSAHETLIKGIEIICNLNYIVNSFRSKSLWTCLVPCFTKQRSRLSLSWDKIFLGLHPIDYIHLNNISLWIYFLKSLLKITLKLRFLSTIIQTLIALGWNIWIKLWINKPQTFCLWRNDVILKRISL